MSYYGGTVTVKGRDLISHLLTGETIELTRIVVGSGEMPEGVEPIDMEDLVTPVALASSTVPTVKDGVLSMTVEYRNDMNGGLETGFWLREFGIFAKTDAEDAEEILLYYATLGDSPQPVNAYTDNRIDTRRYPISIALALDAKVTVVYNPGAFITAEDAEEIIKALVDEAVEELPLTTTEIVTLPVDGWQQIEHTTPDEESGEEEESDEDEETGGCSLYCDAVIEGVTEDMFPVTAIHPNSLETARECELCQTARSMDGAVRFYAKQTPTGVINATVELSASTGTPGGGGGGEYVLPVATRTRLGGVKIGDGIHVDADGTIYVDKDTVMTDDDLLDEDATEEDLRRILNGESAEEETQDEGSGEVDDQDGDDPVDDEL